MTIDQIAQVCHAANSAYCAAVGDPLLPPWDLLDETYKESSRKGVLFAIKGGTPEHQHAAWMDERLSQGWTYGPVLDRGAKVHPNLVSYHALSQAQQRKDALFQAIVHTLM
jgi:RyR domain